MSVLARFTPGAVGVRGGVDPGAGADLAQVRFVEAEVLELADLPTRFRSTRRGAGTIVPISASYDRDVEERPLAGQVVQLDKPRRKPDGSLVQRRIAWSATSQAVTITVVERDLQRIQDGKLRPAGPWLIDTRTIHRHQGEKAALRMGAVAFDETSAAAGSAASITGATINEPEISGESVQPLLPHAVRAQLVRCVPDPSILYGQVLEFPGGRHEIHLLRLDDQNAVAVHAESTRHSRVWSIKQATYALGRPEVER